MLKIYIKKKTFIKNAIGRLVLDVSGKLKDISSTSNGVQGTYVVQTSRDGSLRK